MFDASLASGARENQRMEDEWSPEEIERLRRRRIVRAVVVVVIVVAMVATLLFPVIVRIIRETGPPDTVIVASHRQPNGQMA